MTDEEIRKLAQAILREEEREVLRRARQECLSEDQVAQRMRAWRNRNR
jgi:predicted DNA-binding protein (UPF0251 family)